MDVSFMDTFLPEKKNLTLKKNTFKTNHDTIWKLVTHTHTLFPHKALECKKNKH